MKTCRPVRYGRFFQKLSKQVIIMNNLEIEGTLMKKMGVQSGVSARGEWAKQEFLLEYQDGRFPASAVFSVWGQDKVNELAAFGVGDLIRVSFKVSSREFNGKYYTDLRAWNISRATAADSRPAPAGAKAEPAPSFQSQSAPLPTLDDMPAEPDSDDLPF